MDPLKFPSVPFDHPMVGDIVEIERVRVDFRTEDLHDPFSLELRELFQTLTSMMSARIEGNRTTVADLITEGRSAQHEGRRAPDPVQEVLQLEEAMHRIDALASQGELHLTHHLIRELHRLSVDGLDREGDRTPGSYRSVPVRISGALHQPPDPSSIQPDMDQLLEFANRTVPPQQQLLQVALVHHRFVWIHPFANGNGRVSRLLTYAMLVRLGYTSSSAARPLNPTAVFGADRQAYYDRLASADDLSDRGLFEWCTYVISGLRSDLEAVRTLSERSFLLDDVLEPALKAAENAGDVRSQDVPVLLRTARLGLCKPGDLQEVMPGSASARSQRLRRLVDSGLLRIVEGPRRYAIGLTGNPVTIHIVRRLDELGMLPEILRD